MFRLFRVVIEFPALDRLLGYLERTDQKAVDAQTQRIKNLTAALRAAVTHEEQ